MEHLKQRGCGIDTVVVAVLQRIYSLKRYSSVRAHDRDLLVAMDSLKAMSYLDHA